MNVSIEIGLLVSAFLIFCSILMSKTGYRFGIPTLLMFLLAGMLFGTDGLGIQFDDVSVAQHIGMVALCIILFTGGMDTKMEDIRPVLSPGVMLATSGVFLTTLFCGLFVYWVSGWQLHTASVSPSSVPCCWPPRCRPPTPPPSSTSFVRSKST